MVGMKTFIEQWRASLTDSVWYKDIFNGTSQLKLSYVLRLSFAGALVIATVFLFTLYTHLLPGAKLLVEAQVPDDIVLTVKSGELSINRPMPYVVPLSEDEKVSLGNENFLVIDTSAEATLKSPEIYRTMIFSNKTTYVMQKKNGEISAYYYKDYPDFTFTKENALGILSVITSYAWILALLALIPITLWGFSKMLLISLVAAVLFWVICKMKSTQTPFKQIFAVSTYAYTVIFSINLVLTILGVRGIGFIMSVFITLLVSVFFVFLAKKEGVILSDQNQVL